MNAKEHLEFNMAIGSGVSVEPVAELFLDYTDRIISLDAEMYPARERATTLGLIVGEVLGHRLTIEHLKDAESVASKFSALVEPPFTKAENENFNHAVMRNVITATHAHLVPSHSQSEAK